MNDRPDLARLAGCDGVHLGQDDVAVRDARRIVGPNLLIGVSTHDRAQLDAAILAGAGYLGVGPVFPSADQGLLRARARRPGLRPARRRDDQPPLVRHRRDHRGEPRPGTRSRRHADRRQRRGRARRTAQASRRAAQGAARGAGAG